MKRNFLKIAFVTTMIVWSTDVRAESKVQSLSDGNHLICDRQPANDFTTPALCFSFSKTGNRIVGYYYIQNMKYTDFCIDGEVNNNTVSGQAFYSHRFPEEVVSIASGYQNSQLQDVTAFVAGESDRLKVARARAILEQNTIHFRSALLNLNGLSNYKPGKQSKLSSCF